jgi:hypothetical protein
MLNTNRTVNPYFTVGVVTLATSFFILAFIRAYFFIVWGNSTAAVLTLWAFACLFVATAGQLLASIHVFIK